MFTRHSVIVLAAIAALLPLQLPGVQVAFAHEASFGAAHEAGIIGKLPIPLYIGVVFLSSLVFGLLFVATTGFKSNVMVAISAIGTLCGLLLFNSWWAWFVLGSLSQ